MIPVAQPVFHFEPKDLNSLKDFQEPDFTTYVGDIQNTGIMSKNNSRFEFVAKEFTDLPRIHMKNAWKWDITVSDILFLVLSSISKKLIRKAPYQNYRDSLDKKLKSVMHIEETRIRKFIEYVTFNYVTRNDQKLLEDFRKWKDLKQYMEDYVCTVIVLMVTSSLDQTPILRD